MSTELADDEKTEQADKGELEQLAAAAAAAAAGSSTPTVETVQADVEGTPPPAMGARGQPAPPPSRDANSDSLLGEVLANRYQIEFRLGEGAMGSVYKAKHVKVGRPFAVKILHKKLLEDKKVAQRFEREAELAGRLRHPNVVGVVDVGETTDGLRYMVMDFAQGTDLATLLSEAPMPAARIMHLTRQMLEGLYHAHEAGLIHRDFKPENVIIEKDDHGTELPRIVDFGIAILREGGSSASSSGRLTTNGLVLGTPHYMAPEQAVADPIDHRIDLFALGIVVYEMLCGKLPFDGTGAEVARANLLLDPPPISTRVPYLEVDPLLEAFARQMMAKKRDLRPATAKAARELLDLIDKDRAAAAAALGVPLNVVRPSNITGPGMVRVLDEEPEELDIPMDPPVIASSKAVPLAPVLVQPSSAPVVLPGITPRPAPPPRAGTNPPVRASTAPPIPRTSRERDIATDATPPLSWEEPQRKKRGWLIGGVAALVAGGAIAFVALGGEKKGASNDAVATVAGSDTGSAGSAAVVDPTPTPTPVPTNGSADAGSADAGSAAVVTPVDAGLDPDAIEIEPENTTDTIKRPKDRGKRPKDRGKGQTQVAVKEPDPGKVTPPSGSGSGSGSATQVAVKEPVKQPDPPAGGVTAGALYQQYAQVGAALKSLQQTKGDAAVADLWPKYRLIQIQDATSTQAKRDQAAAILAGLSKAAAGRR